MQDRIRAKLSKSAPPAAAAEGAAATGNEPALPDDPDTLAAQLSESENEVAR